MADEVFSDNLLRMIAADLHLLTTITAAREMFGRGYFSLGHPEKIAVDRSGRARTFASKLSGNKPPISGQPSDERTNGVCCPKGKFLGIIFKNPQCGTCSRA